MKVNFFKSTIVAAILVANIIPATALAAGTSTYSLQQSGNTIRVYETSTVAVNTVEADFSYADPQSAVQSVSVAPGGTFTTCPSPSSTSIVCSALGGNITGTNLVATLTVNLKSGVSAANVTATMLDSSAIYASVGNTDTLDHSSLPSTTYSYTAPAQTQPVGGKGGGSAGNTGSNTNNTTTSTAESSASGSVSGASTSNPSSNQSNTATGTNGKKTDSANKTVLNSPATVAQSSNTWAWATIAVALVAIAGALAWLFRGRLPVSLPKLATRA